MWEATVLFNTVSILDVLPDQLRQIKQKVQELKADYVLNASEEDLVAALVDEFMISSIIIRETKAQLPDPPQKARLYFENTPRLEGAHIMASALKEEVQLSYGRRDLRIFYVNPDPALEGDYFKNMATQDAYGYLFSFNWHKTQLLLLRGPLRLQTN